MAVTIEEIEIGRLQLRIGDLEVKITKGSNLVRLDGRPLPWKWLRIALERGQKPRVIVCLETGEAGLVPH